MNARFKGEQGSAGTDSVTLESLLDGGSKPRISEDEWLALIRGVAAGDTSTFGTLYTWTHGIVFTLMMRISRNRELAEALTVDVFHEVWRSAGTYDPANGPVVGWILNLARVRALERLRADGVEKFVTDRVDPVEREKLQKAFRDLSPAERRTIESAYFSKLTYLEVGARDRQPIEIVKVIIRGAVNKVRAYFTRRDEQR
jgi:RNA polymerase sigma-70 factor, ECF subfamily